MNRRSCKSCGAQSDTRLCLPCRERIADRLIATAASNCSGVKWRRHRRLFRALCPAHQDRKNASLVVWIHNGYLCVKCWAGCEKSAIWQALKLPAKDHVQQSWSPPPAARRAKPPPEPEPWTPERIRFLWSSTISDPGFVREYLINRRAWPPGAELPESVRVLDSPRIAMLKPARLPPRSAGAAGLMSCAFTDPGGDITAISFEALRADGSRPATRWRRTFGARRGSVFEAGGDGDVITAAEGEVSALACRWLHPGSRCIGTGGTAQLSQFSPCESPGTSFTLAPDGDRHGRRAAAEAEARLEAAGHHVRIEHSPDGADPADVLRAEIDQLAAYLNFGSELDFDQSLATAWKDYRCAP